MKLKTLLWCGMLLGSSFFFASVITALWWLVFFEGDRSLSPSQDIRIISNGVLTILGVAYSVLASLLIYGVWKQHHQARSAVALGKKKEFLESNIRIPFVLHLLMGVISLNLIILLAFLPYENLKAGTLTIFSVSFVFCLLLLVALVLDDPYCEAWDLHAPREWIDQAKKEAEKRRSKLKEENNQGHKPAKKTTAKKGTVKRSRGK